MAQQEKKHRAGFLNIIYFNLPDFLEDYSDCIWMLRTGIQRWFSRCNGTLTKIWCDTQHFGFHYSVIRENGDRWDNSLVIIRPIKLKETKNEVKNDCQPESILPLHSPPRCPHTNFKPPSKAQTSLISYPKRCCCSVIAPAHQKPHGG